MSGRAISYVETDVLTVGYERHGPAGGWPVMLAHGFPYDVRCYDEVVPVLAAAGADVVVPYLRGYGPTRFRSPATMRSGQQGALGADLRALIAALDLDRPVVGGYDWGGRAACVVAALWPDEVSGLVSVSGYNIQDIAAAGTPAPPASESRLWYQYYLHGERGRAGLAAYRAEYARQLWTEWSPTWDFDDTTFAASAPSFDNPDFVEVVVHSYRHRYGLVAGDPGYADIERRLAAQPAITTPAVVLLSTTDPLQADASDGEVARYFGDLRSLRRIAAGHDLPQERPAEFAAAVLALHQGPTRRSS